MFVLPSHYSLMSSHAGLSVFQGYLDRLREFLVSGSTAPPTIDKSSAYMRSPCSSWKSVKISRT